MKQLSIPRVARWSIVSATLVGAMTFCAEAQARPNIKRKGGQWGIMLGGSACIPGRADCSRDEITVDGSTRPSFGLGAELGYRFNRFIFLGASYNLGFYNADYTGTGFDGYKRAYQNSIFGVVRGTIPVWRFDFGLGAGPGWSRLTFKYENDDKDYSQGFAWKFEPSIDIWVSRRIFIGAKADVILNAHSRVCSQTGSDTSCRDAENDDQAPVHQVIFGLHLGGTFL